MILKLEISHISVKSYKAVGFLLLTDKVFTIVGYDSRGWYSSICSKATHVRPHLILCFCRSHLPKPNLLLQFAGEVLCPWVFNFAFYVVDSQPLPKLDSFSLQSLFLASSCTLLLSTLSSARCVFWQQRAPLCKSISTFESRIHHLRVHILSTVHQLLL